MALNLDFWSDHEIIKDAINLIEKSASKELVLPVLKIMRELRRKTRLNVFKMWVPREDEEYCLPDLFYPEFSEPIRRENQSWASFQPARLGLVYSDIDVCYRISKMLQVLGKLANISSQQRQKWKPKCWTLVVRNDKFEIMESDFNSVVGFSSRENAQLAWDTLTEEEQAIFRQGFAKCINVRIPFV